MLFIECARRLADSAYSIAVICSIGLVMVFVSYPLLKLSNKVGQFINDHLLELDVVGATVGILVLILFSFVWSQAAISD